MFWQGFDVDRAGTVIDWSDCNPPAPTPIIKTPKTDERICAMRSKKSSAPRGAKRKPYTSVKNALCEKLDADVDYFRLICKNQNLNLWEMNLSVVE
ncbi:replication initiation protein [Gibbsiella quercinecans]|uniref:replication initiation protein n=1 Tax=Gibbsiella quercinecans TaxID=929813 RepID=UPI000BB00D35